MYTKLDISSGIFNTCFYNLIPIYIGIFFTFVFAKFTAFYEKQISSYITLCAAHCNLFNIFNGNT